MRPILCIIFCACLCGCGSKDDRPQRFNAVQAVRDADGVYLGTVVVDTKTRVEYLLPNRGGAIELKKGGE